MSDLIDRQAAIDELHMHLMYRMATESNKQRLDAWINNLPSAQPYSEAEIQKMQELEQAEIQRAYELGKLDAELRWVPCSETIDIPDHEVLCCDRRGEEMIGWLSHNDDQWLCESEWEVMYDPIAWREKPEPYRVEGENG